MNLSAALRLGWTGRLIGVAGFFLPMMWLGFAPSAVFTTLNLSLLYQFWIHTTWIPKLGPLEWVLNTPSHHRVHHAANPEYRDRNFGGTLIVFDRLFGTFAAAPGDEALRFGLKGRAPSNNPLTIAFNEWQHLAVDAWRASGLRRKLEVLFGPP